MIKSSEHSGLFLYKKSGAFLNWHKQVTVIAGVFLIYGFNMDFIIKIMSIVRE